MVEVPDSDIILSKRKAISTLLPYAIFLEQGGQQWFIDAIFRVARASGAGNFMWHRIMRYISRLFEKRSPTSLDRVIALASPYVDWAGALNSPIAVTRWVEAASATPYTEEVGQSVVDALFQIAYLDLLRPHIPIDIWGWIKRQPSLPPVRYEKQRRESSVILFFVHGLGDIEIFKSYLLLVWTDQWIPDPSASDYTEISIREVFGKSEMEHHRRDLIERLDHVLGQLDQRLEVCREHNQLTLERDLQDAKTRYTGFKRVLLEVHGQ